MELLFQIINLWFSSSNKIITPSWLREFFDTNSLKAYRWLECRCLSRREKAHSQWWRENCELRRAVLCKGMCMRPIYGIWCTCTSPYCVSIAAYIASYIQTHTVHVFTRVYDAWAAFWENMENSLHWQFVSKSLKLSQNIWSFIILHFHLMLVPACLLGPRRRHYLGNVTNKTRTRWPMHVAHIHAYNIDILLARVQVSWVFWKFSFILWYAGGKWGVMCTARRTYILILILYYSTRLHWNWWHVNKHYELQSLIEEGGFDNFFFG